MLTCALALLLVLYGVAVSVAACRAPAADLARAHAPFLLPACLGVIAGVL